MMEIKVVRNDDEILNSQVMGQNWGEVTEERRKEKVSRMMCCDEMRSRPEKVTKAKRS